MCERMFLLYASSMLSLLLAGQRAAYGQCEPVCPPADLVFIMDTSGSMEDESRVLCVDTAYVVEDLAEYGFAVSPSYLGITNLGTDLFPCLTDSVLSLLGSPVPGSSSCGADLEQHEDWAPAVAIVAERFPWSEGAIRLIVPLSDEAPCAGDPCEDPGADREAIANAIEIAGDHNVIVSPITGTGSGPCTIRLARDLADSTGGVTHESTVPQVDMAGAIRAILADACEQFTDCNTNGIPDLCEIEQGWSGDCNLNGVPDECELAANPDADTNSNGVLDDCDECVWDSDCDDGLFCTGREACKDANCQQGEAPCAGGGCDEDHDRCGCTSDAECDDGIFCNGPEQCDASWCVAGSLPCSGMLCDEATDACVACATDSHCNDGQFCNGLEVCVDGACQAGASPCDEGECCKEATDVCRPCPCTSDADCDDGDDCTLDTCDLTTSKCNWVVADTDDDGISDCVDRCLDTPAGAEVDDEGCSCHAWDWDGDGVSYCYDLCDRTPIQEQADANGCSCSQLDDDHDGVTNCHDECRTTPAGEPVDERGCPPSAPPAEPEARQVVEEVLTSGGGGPARCGACGSVGMGTIVMLATGMRVLRGAQRRSR